MDVSVEEQPDFLPVRVEGAEEVLEFSEFFQAGRDHRAHLSQKNEYSERPL